MFKNGPFPVSFSLFSSLLQTVNSCSVTVAHDWIRTRILWYQSQPCCHSHCTLFKIVIFLEARALIVSKDRLALFSPIFQFFHFCRFEQKTDCCFCSRRRRRRLDLTLMMTSRLFPERDPGQVNFVSTESVFNLRLDPVSRKLEIQSVPDFGSAPKIMLR